MRIPELKIITEDPLQILESTKDILMKPRFVSIDKKSINKTANSILKRFQKGFSEQQLEMGTTGNMENDLQLVFLENSVNFCFWPDKGITKWEVEWPFGKTIGGWYGLVSCFKRALAKSVPILNVEYLSSLNIDDAKIFFRGINTVEIPLLKERIQNLRETGKILLENFDGKFINVLETSQFDAIKLVKLLQKNFPSFNDISSLDGKEVVFLKRAQICANDISYILKEKHKKIAGLEKLTAFADYKLPQILREFGVLRYNDALARAIDSLNKIPHDSREEIEIRAVTVWAVELLRQEIKIMSAGEIDNTLWFMSQEIQQSSKPYHRTRTIYY
ncbi:MAG: hypothetical protein A3G49_04315 [Candidatus Sungbacteria bacterium RIFCSPLOWO2_12_FULL_41_11]|uniref:Queuosine 5'-phosphate N-glycosylase/hydrolase n=1 Tax=Candidatus Sungbacteria bacterium RIFCSPLOWO2_12_FULL_41_11 TaxID=1802286 RepID=A0A1G2LTK2_9BACT|nr:MAG: hypothetical protein UV01_C0010G0004 [Parcubacteria group bacterium GW2011_GWA2_42_14]OHA14883.1 MAG: hypothetical protein A3G49_04315 [Candidatus Sungbacteria bacterium RIFCSPLOWO2_12_FULL_41_11]